MHAFLSIFSSEHTQKSDHIIISAITHQNDIVVYLVK